MSLALKRIFPKFYNFSKKFEKYIPASTILWDKKKYRVNLKIISMLSYWREWPRLIAEAELVFDLYNGGDFLDIGAYHGVYPFFLAPKAKKNDTFILCEPDSEARKDLVENLNVLKRLFKNIDFRCIYEPIGDGKNVVKTPTIYGHPMFLSQTNDNKNNQKENFFQRSLTLDELVKKNNIKPSFIKIDVEGTEYNILQGMVGILKTYKPLIMIEKHPTLIPKDVSISDIDNFLTNSGYRLEKEIYKDDIAITEFWKKYN